MRMRDNISPDRIANSIRMNKNFKGIYLIVEGETDFKVYNMLVKRDIVEIKEAFGKDKVIKVLEILQSEGTNNVIGIVDSDFENITNSGKKVNGLFKTDYHDIEVMMYKTKALEKVVNSLCSREKIDSFERNKSIRQSIMNIAIDLGILKFINNEKKLELRFKPQDKDGPVLKYKEIVNDEDFTFLGIDNLIEVVLKYAENRSKITKETFKEYYNEIDISKYNQYDLVNGHDLSNLLFILMKKTLKSSSKILKDYTCVEESLIIGYDVERLIETKLYKQLLKWQRDNDIEMLKYDERYILEKAT